MAFSKSDLSTPVLPAPVLGRGISGPVCGGAEQVFEFEKAMQNPILASTDYTKIG